MKKTFEIIIFTSDSKKRLMWWYHKPIFMSVWDMIDEICNDTEERSKKDKLKWVVYSIKRIN